MIKRPQMLPVILVTMLEGACTLGPVVLAALALSGCAAGRDDEGDLGVAWSNLEDSNALNPNALNPNALNPNALNPNALNPNALNPNALSPDALTAITRADATGDLSRQLLSYTVGCALDPTQTFNFSWSDGRTVHAESYVGILGLQPSWASAPLTHEGGLWISACLASRVNWYGIPVMLSSRGAHNNLRNPSSAELAGYTVQEGAFWGDLFGASPVLYACDDTANDDHAHTKLRDCASGHSDGHGHLQSCGMIQRVGSCDTHCAALDSVGQYHPSCSPGGPFSPSTYVVTVFLQ